MAEGRPVPTMTLPDLEALAGAQATQSMQPREKREVRAEREQEREREQRDALDVPMSSLSSRSTASTTLQTPRTAQTPLPQPKEKGKGSLSKAASQTLKRHPVSQVFRRWGGERGVAERECS